MLVAWLGASGALSPAGAQAPPAPRPEPTIRLDAVAATAYYWRGIRRSGFPVIQLDAAAGLLWGPFSLTAGVWANYEARAPRQLSGLVRGKAEFSEHDLWGQAALRTGDLTVAGGVLRSAYRQSPDDNEIAELFGLARWQAERWSYALSVWHAVSGAKGTYLEPSITFTHAVNPFAGPALSLATTLRAGVQAGPRQTAGSTLVPGATGTGLTHLALAPAVAAVVKLPARFALTATASLELAWRRDPATRVRADGSPGARLHLRAPLQLGVRWPYRRPQ